MFAGRACARGASIGMPIGFTCGRNALDPKHRRGYVCVPVRYMLHTDRREQEQQEEEEAFVVVVRGGRRGAGRRTTVLRRRPTVTDAARARTRTYVHARRGRPSNRYRRVCRRRCARPNNGNGMRAAVVLIIPTPYRPSRSNLLHAVTCVPLSSSWTGSPRHPDDVNATRYVRDVRDETVSKVIPASRFAADFVETISAGTRHRNYFSTRSR